MTSSSLTSYFEKKPLHCVEYEVIAVSFVVILAFVYKRKFSCYYSLKEEVSVRVSVGNFTWSTEPDRLKLVFCCLLSVGVRLLLLHYGG